MKSKAHIKGHPLHLILVNFPIAFFIGILLFDTLAWVYPTFSFYQTALYLEVLGVASAFCAAMPGIVDYVYTVPPQSTAKSRAAKHGLLNSAALLLFIGALGYRLSSHNHHLPVLVFMEATGDILIGIAGWMGGTLVLRNQIGIDIRYANAGKWKEVYLQKRNGEVELGSLEGLMPDQMVLVHVEKKRIVVAKTNKGIVAFDDKCSHRGGSLAGGAMVCGYVQCPWHGSQFDVETGKVQSGPATKKLETYFIKEEKGVFFLQF
jgi:nitrite reductase/ring-hydroxylating ferredoxin subunit/uncharacterized membrane protein